MLLASTPFNAGSSNSGSAARLGEEGGEVGSMPNPWRGEQLAPG